MGWRDSPAPHRLLRAADLTLLFPHSLCRAPSNRVKGTPFRPVKAVAMDLFPQTPHCEMLILFERTDHSNGVGDLVPPEPPVQSPEGPLSDTSQENRTPASL